jgi:hypothetical protein
MIKYIAQTSGRVIIWPCFFFEMSIYLYMAELAQDCMFLLPAIPARSDLSFYSFK